MIVKVQRPVAGDPSALIYNEDRSIFHQCPVEDVADLFDEGELKVYFDADLVDDQLVFLERVKDQSW